MIAHLSYYTHDNSYDGQKKIFDNPVFIIEHTKGRLIWDVALPDSLADRDKKEIDSSESNFVREKLINQLNAMNLTPNSIFLHADFRNGGCLLYN